MKTAERSFPRPNFYAVLTGVLLALLGSAPAGLAQSSTPKNPAGAGTENPLSRGEYIVEGLSVCGQCHTPRDSNGNPNPAKQLEGAPVWLQSAKPVENWPTQAPRLAGSPPATDEELIKLLTTGVWRDGTYLRPPMPQFRMSRQDAEAVIAYLKSLNPRPQ